MNNSNEPSINILTQKLLFTSIQANQQFSFKTYNIHNSFIIPNYLIIKINPDKNKKNKKDNKK